MINIITSITSMPLGSVCLSIYLCMVRRTVLSM